MGYIDPVVHYDFSVDGKTTAIENLKTVLTAASWTSSGVGAEGTLTMTGNATNGQTVTIDATVYTYKTTPGAPPDVAIGATIDDSLNNLKSAIESVQGSLLTVTRPTSSTLTIVYTAGGTAGNGKTLGETITGTWNFTTTRNGGYKILSPPTAAGLDGVLAYFYDDSTANRIKISIRSSDEVTVSQEYQLATDVVARRLRAVADPQSFWSYLPGSYTGTARGTILNISVPTISSDMAGIAISGVSASGSLIKITTSSAHGLTSGQQAFIAGVIGVPANGLWTVTVVDTTNVTLDTSTFSGSYVSGGFIAGQAITGYRKRFSRIFWAYARRGELDTSSGDFTMGWRAEPGGNSPTQSSPEYFACANGVSRQILRQDSRPKIVTLPANQQRANLRYEFHEAHARFSVTAGADPHLDHGEVPNAAVLTTGDPTVDQPFDTPDGKHWIVYGKDTGNGLSVCLRVPASVTTI